MTQKALTLSLVIPAYNEGWYLEACLKSVAAQSVMPSQVVVVDNNSTDNTAQIAKQFTFVTVLAEPEQGILPARNTGFNAAHGDIIGRIDADTRLPRNWVEQVVGHFRDNPAAQALSSGGFFYNAPMPRLVHFLHYVAYFWVQRWTAGMDVLWGSNMALRTTAWQQVGKDKAYIDGHEDTDLMLKLKRRHLKTIYVKKLPVKVSMRRGDTSVIRTGRYLLAAPLTYWQNRYYIRGVVLLLCYGLLYVLALPVLLFLTLFGRQS